MCKKVEKSTVTDKEAIEQRLYRSYNMLASANSNSEEQARSFIIRVEKLSEYVKGYYFSTYIYCDNDDMDDTDYYFGFEMSMWIRKYFLPASIITHEGIF